MPINLSKGQKVDLTKGNPGLKNIMVGLGWDVNAFDSGVDFDLDAAAFMLGADGKCPTDKEFVFYGNLAHPSESVKHMGDNLTGEGEGDDEQIQIDLSKVPANIERIAFTVTIYEAATGDESIQFELTSLNQALMMMEQRTQDLRTAENVAMQSIPMIKTMEFSNYNLVRKINSAFIVTLPVFKQALAQAILLKRQRIQAEAMSALDKKTNEMLIKNAQNTVEVSKATAKMASGSSIQIETLETTWRTITSGIEETKRIQEDCRKKRVEDQARLEAIKADFNRQYHMPPANK